MVRDQILNLLASHPGEFVSGEVISQGLNLTRAAVWKQIQGLKEAGYRIEAMTKHGYRLLGTPTSLDEWALRSVLKTEQFGGKLYLYNELPSTNDLAKDLGKKGGEHGTVVIAQRQTAGHGRMRREWQSPAGGLWMSVVLQPKLSLADAAKSTLAAGVAVVDGLGEACGFQAGIKWPNDVVYEGKKLAGILAEVAGEWTTVQTIVIGIGLNANIRREDLGTELPAVSVQEVLRQPVNLNELAACILYHLEMEIRGLELGLFADLRERWLDRAVGLGQESVVVQGERRFEGVFRGVAEDGRLVLQVGDENLTFSAAEVRFRSRTGAFY